MKDQSSASGFFAQGGLILLPVLVLAFIGLNALRQDRRALEADATERAQKLAAEWLKSVSFEWAAAEENTTNRLKLLQSFSLDQAPRACFFEVDAQGRLVYPAPSLAVPEPQPFSHADLNPDQARLWEAAQRLEISGAPGAGATQACERFLESHPPSRHAAAARFALGSCLSKAGQVDAAVEIFHNLAKAFPTELSETGLPFEHLAYLRLFQLERGRSIAREILCSNVVYRPSMLTPKLLESSGQAASSLPSSLLIDAQYQAIWAHHEWARKVFERVKDHFPSRTDRAFRLPHAFVVSLDKPAAVVRVGDAGAETAKLLAVLPGSAPVQAWRRDELAGARGDVFAVTVTVAGLDVYREGFPADETIPSVKPGERLSGEGGSAPIAGATKSEEGVEVLKIQVHLANSALFYARHRQRTTWLAVVIASAATAAVLGWIAMRRAFARQRQLAEMKTNFVSSVSHELRAPIASVRLMAEGLESGRIKDESKKHEYFKFIVQECRRLSALIENVLDFSRIEQGRKQYELELTDVSALIHQSAKLMEPCATERQIRLEIADSRPSTLTAQPILDGRAIQQALVNLLDNAIKHSPKGSLVVIGLELLVQPESDSHYTDHASRFTLHVPRLRIWVEDHGEGIPPEEHERIFERFYRLGPELRRETQGVGIGLSLVKHIVEAHGGRVLVRSAVGQGSRFTMELPISPDQKGKTRWSLV